MYDQPSRFSNRHSSLETNHADFFDVPPWKGPPRPPSPRGEGPPRAGGPLVTSRNNSHPPPAADLWRGPWRPVRAYVGACCTGTLALYYGDGRVVFGALACGSWTCAHCRPRLAARQLDRLRRGMESRPDNRRTLVTLTVDPFKFGAVRVGTNVQKDGRKTAMVSEATSEQFAAAAAAMSKEWDALNKRLGQKAKRAGVERVGYFRVVELHRNGWPHYHVIVEHPTWGADELSVQLSGWKLGRVQADEVSLDAAVGEVAPYLTSAEKKGNGSKAYQFAGMALPEGFRLVSSSRDFLGALLEVEDRPEHGVAIRGHFTSYHQAAREMGAETRLVLHPATEGVYRPPSRTIALGDAAVAYYAALVAEKAMHEPLVKVPPLTPCQAPRVGPEPPEGVGPC